MKTSKPVAIFFIGLSAALMFTVTCSAQAVTKLKTQSRITGGISEDSVTTLAGSMHPAAKALPDVGRLPSDKILERMTMVFKLSDQQQGSLNALLQEQQDPASPNYHKWLAPEEFNARFGVSDSDLAKVKSWLQSRGFEVNEQASDRTMVVFSGPAGQAESAFHTELHQYESDGAKHFANATAISIPSALAELVQGVRALNDFRPHPRPHIRHVHSNFTSSISGSHFLAPDDFATIYDLKPLYGAGVDGTGQNIAIVGQSDIELKDIRAFRSASGLPARDPQILLVPGSSDPGVVSGDIDEASLDVEWSGAVAPGANIIFVNSKNGALDSLQFAIQVGLAQVISSSYGDCEQHYSSTDLNSFTSLLQRANAQGQTVVGAAGDSGAADCDFPATATAVVTSAKQGFAVDFPPSSPNVTAVGGSRFNEGTGAFWNSTNNTNNGSAISYIPEIAWNDTTFEIGNGGSLSAGGGGASIKFTKPSWQTGAGVPADGQRDLPDVTFAASSDHDGYLICSQGSCVNGYRRADAQMTLNVVGGTSVGAPTFAGLVALVNQKTQSSQGNINPALYRLAASTPAAFHDIVSGDNKVPCTAGSTSCPSSGSFGFTAGPGFDLVTGLGSLDGAVVVNTIAATTPPNTTPDFSLSASNTAMTVTHGTSSTDTVTVSALNGFSGTVTLTCQVSSSLPATTCSVAPSSVTGSGSPVVTVTAGATAAIQSPPFPGHSTFWASGTFGLFAFVFAGAGLRRRSHKTIVMFLLVAMLGMVAAGCGGGSSSASAPSTPNATGAISTPASGVIIVQGTSGSSTHTVLVTININ